MRSAWSGLGILTLSAEKVIPSRKQSSTSFAMWYDEGGLGALGRGLEGAWGLLTRTEADGERFLKIDVYDEN